METTEYADIPSVFLKRALVKILKEQHSIKKYVNKGNHPGFDFNILARGSLIDDLRAPGYPKSLFKIETTTIRLNHIALNEYLGDCITSNCRECYVDGEEGDKQWEQRQADVKANYNAWKNKILFMLGIALVDDKASAVITQAQSEIFTVVYTVRI